MNKKLLRTQQQYLFHICFDSPGIFRKNMYFNFEGFDFKLIKGTKRYQEVLCCIIDIEHSSGPDFDRKVSKVWEIALKFLSCLSWELNIGIRGCFCGGSGWGKEHGSLSSVKRRTCIRMPRKWSSHRFSDVLKLPNIDTDNKARALSFFREAKAANSLYYKFLCYWKILEICGENVGKWDINKTKNWINKTIKSNKWILKRAHFEEEMLGNESIGEYLYKTCRIAIAHAMLSTRKNELKPDSGESLKKVNVANWIIVPLVDIFMKKDLGIQFLREDTGNYLFLKKKKGKAIPVYEQGLRIGDGHLIRIRKWAGLT